MKFFSKTIEYGLYLLVFFLPLQTRWIIRQGTINNGPWEYGTYSLYGTDLLLIIILILFIIFSANNLKFKIFNLKLISNLLIFGLLAASAVSVFFAADKLLALYKFGWLLMGAGLFWLLAGGRHSRLKLIWSFLAGLALQSGLAVWQFLSQASFANKWLGLAGRRSADLGASVVEAAGPDGIGERWLRAYGGLDHPNILGGLIAIGILFLIGEVIDLEKFSKFLIFPPWLTLRRINNFKFFNKFQIKFKITKISALKAGYWLLLVLFSTTLFFTFSRSAWLALAAGLAVWLAQLIIKKNLRAQKSLLEAVLIMGAMLFILFLAYPNLTIARLGGGPELTGGARPPNRLEIKSYSERAESLKDSLLIIKKHWLSGSGIGNYTLALRDQAKPGEPGYYYQPAHNVLMLVWAEAGIFGLIFFAGLIMYLIIFNFQFSIFPPKADQPRANKQFPTNKFSKLSLKIWEKDNLKDLTFGAPVLAALIILLSFDHWLWSLHFGVIFFWLVLGLAAGNSSAAARRGRDGCNIDATHGF